MMPRIGKESFSLFHYIAGISCIILVSAILVAGFLGQNRQAIAARDDALRSLDTLNDLYSLENKAKNAALLHHRYLLLETPQFKRTYRYYLSKNADPSDAPPDDPNASSIGDDIDRLSEQFLGDPQQTATFEQIKTTFQALWASLDDIIETHDAGQKQKALEKLDRYMTEHAKPARELLQSLAVRERKLLDERVLLRDKKLAMRNNLVLGFIAFFAIFESVVFSFLLHQGQKTRAAEKLARARADEAEGINRKLDLANKELSELNETIQKSKETQIKAIVDNAIDGQIMMDEEGTIVRYNLAAQKMFQYAPSEAIGRNIDLLLVEPYATECKRILRKSKKTGSLDSLESRLENMGRRKNGSFFPFELSMSTFYLGGQLHFSWFIRDITERKRTEAEILRYTKELEKSNQDLDDFAYIASHDLKEPLRGLFNHAQFLQEDYEDKLDDDGKRRLKRLSFLSQRMEHLVNDLLYFSRLGRSDLAIQETDPNSIVIEIQQMLEPMLKEKNVRIDIATPLPTIVCDKTRIGEVFRNLITNAVKYNNKPEKIVEVGFLSISNAPHGMERDVFYVKDNGIGIEHQYFQEIFRIFRRLNKSKGDDQSTGSGLTFVKKIIERHKGHIWLESEPDLGTTFYFNLGPMEASA